MRVLKITGIIVLAVLMLLMVIALILPKEIKIEQPVVIEASVEHVFPQVSNFKNMEVWSPWKDYDPEMIVTYEGEDGKEGAVYEWSGNKDVGSGQQKIIKLKENERIDIKLSFFEPWNSESDIYFIFNEIDKNKTEVIWGYIEETPIPKNLLFTAFGLKKSLKKEFDKGLNRLKDICEN